VIVSGTKELAAPRETVWGVINEPSEMAKLMPGVESFEVKDERHWTARVKVPLGLGGLKMTISFEKLDERAPEFASMRAKGQGVGALMDMTTSFTLSEVSDVLKALEKRVAEAAGGSSTGGAEHGIHPGSPEAYEPEPEGPTHST
jgi:carbon monoxide dehydrogenase subunit G